MGSQSPGYSSVLYEKLLEELDGRPDVHWVEIYWQDIVEGRQAGFLREATTHHDLDWVDLRRFIVRALSDVIAFRPSPKPDGTYARVTTRIAENLGHLERNELPDEPVPLVVLAHSLGGHVFSSYAWDRQQGLGMNGIRPTGASALPELTPFQRMETLTGIVTFGCNLPLFTFACDPVETIQFPPSTLPAEWAERARWLNVYDPDDALGFPLHPTSASYQAVVDEDRPIQVGSLVDGWTPFSHNRYWEDGDLVDAVAEVVRGVAG